MTVDPKKLLWLAVALFLIAALLRFYRIANQSLWIDEVWSLSQARLDWQVLLSPGGYTDIHPPVYYLCLKCVAPLADVGPAFFEAALRMLSVVSSTLAVLALVWLGTIVFDRPTGVLGGLFLAVSAFSIWYAQEVRMYSLALLLVILQLALAVRIKKAKASLGAWVLLYCVSVAAGLTHWYSVFVWPFLVGYPLWGAPARRIVLRWLGFFLAVSIPLALYLIPKIAQGRGGEMSGTSDLKNLMFTLWSFWTGYSAGPSVLELHTPEPFALMQRFIPSILLMGSSAALVTVLAASPLLRTVPRSQAVWLVTWFLLALVGPFLLARLTGRVHNARYSFAAFPAAVLLIAAAARYAPKTWQRAGICAGYLLPQILCLANYYWNPYYWREDFRSVAGYLEEHPESQGALLSSSVAQDALAAYGVIDWEWEDYPHWRPWSEELRDRMAGHLSGGQELWHLTADRWRTKEQAITRYLIQNFLLLQQRRWHGVELNIYGSP
ncbi:MAG: glycosyltransferase family 39 protein [Phycisphaerales bacterium]|nr:MAG: glycosyltransferase family 39 protein [Phycisphaerales bacterium]